MWVVPTLINERDRETERYREIERAGDGGRVGGAVDPARLASIAIYDTIRVLGGELLATEQEIARPDLLV